MKYMYLEDKESGKKRVKIVGTRESIEEVKERYEIKCIGSIYTIMKKMESENE